MAIKNKYKNNNNNKNIKKKDGFLDNFFYC